MFQSNTADVDDFLAHYGIKGMKWGRRRSPAQLDQASGESSGKSGSSGEDPSSKRRMSPETKRKLVIGAGIVGAAAAIAVGTYAVNKQINTNKLTTLAEMRKQVETRRAGEAAAKAQLQAFNQKSKWKLSTHSKSTREGKKAAEAEVAKYDAQKADRHKAFAQRTAANRAAQEKRERRINSLTPSGREKNRAKDLAKTREHINAFAKKSMWELANELPAKKSPKTTPYSAKDAKKDAKLYGAAGAARIQKNLDKGMLLSEARQKEAVKKYGATAVKVALNVHGAQKQESKLFNQLRKG